MKVGTIGLGSNFGTIIFHKRPWRHPNDNAFEYQIAVNLGVEDVGRDVRDNCGALRAYYDSVIIRVSTS